MKVTFFHPAFRGLGGAELLGAAQASFLRSQGEDVALVTFDLDEKIWGSRFEGMDVHVIPRHHWTDVFSFGSKLRKWQRRAQRSESILRSADVVLAHNPPAPAMLGHVATTALRTWYCHEAPWRLHPESTDYFLMQHLPPIAREAAGEQLQRLMDTRSQILARAHRNRSFAQWDLEGVARLDRIFANSEYCARNLRLIYGRSDVSVIPPIISFGSRAHRSGLDRDGLQVLTLARLEQLKNVETVIRGFVQFAEQSRTRPTLHVVGDGRERATLESLVQELKTSARVVFHGYLDPQQDQSELDALFEACDVFALLPIDESFGMVYPEAASRGLLLVGSDHGGPVEILEGGRLGWTVPPLVPEALCAVFEEVCSLSDAEVDRRRFEADRACRARFSVDAVGPLLKNGIT